jgi:hypothetical protein
MTIRFGLALGFVLALVMAWWPEQAAAQTVPKPPGPGGYGGYRPPPPPPPVVERRRSNNGAKIGAGIAAGVVGAIILNEAIRNQDRGGGNVRVYEEERRPRYSCRSLARICDDGERWACRRFDEQCE